MFIHLDCNNFFVSCELVSRPELRGTPVVVANDNGNNGGIILALNQEAKAVGLKRGNPLFQVKELIDRHKVTIIDVHHHLYHEVSQRIMEEVRYLYHARRQTRTSPCQSADCRSVGSEAWVHRFFNVTGVRTWKELKGIPAITLASRDWIFLRLKRPRRLRVRNDSCVPSTPSTSALVATRFILPYKASRTTPRTILPASCDPIMSNSSR